MRKLLVLMALLGGCGSKSALAPGPAAPPGIGMAGGASRQPGPADAGVPVAEDPRPLVQLPVAPALPVRHRITLVGATLEPVRPDGRNWDSGEKIEGNVPGPRSVLAGYLAGHPELERSKLLIGEPMATPQLRKDATRSTEPDPYVFIQIGDQVFRSPLVASTFAPVWNFTFEVVATPGDTRAVHVTVVDWDGTFAYEVLGEADLPLGELVAGRFKWVRSGTVAGLTFAVETAPTGGLDHRVAVSAKVTWHDTAIDLVAGQRVHLEAAGDLCSKSGSKCAGPEGQAATSSYSLEGFKELPHAALVAWLGDTRFLVGRDLSFVAPSSGRLLLGINDQEVGDNSGFFDVRIRAE